MEAGGTIVVTALDPESNLILSYALSICPDKIFFVPDKIFFVPDKIFFVPDKTNFVQDKNFVVS